MTFRLSKGLATFKKKAKERESQFVSRFVFLKEDGARARLRFLTDADDFQHGIFHTPFGGKTVIDPVLCLDAEGIPEGVDATACRWCQTNDKPRQQFYAWAYVYFVLHPQQNSKLDSDSNATAWEPIKGPSGKTMFKQDIQALKILRGGQKMLGRLEALYGELGTLLGQDFSMVRSGKELDTEYDFVPTGKMTKETEKVTEAIKKLGDLEEAALLGTVTFYSTAPAEEDEEPGEVPFDDGTSEGGDEDEFTDL